MTKLRGAALGFLLGSLPGVVFLLWSSAVNPFFLDEPLSYVWWALFLPSLVPISIATVLVHFGKISAPGRRPLLIGLALMGLVLLVCAFRPRPSIENTKLLVVGWDGATFSQIDPLVSQGRLPEMAELRKQGSSSVLRSMEPMFSPLLWTTMATGKTPAEHGVRGFSVHASDVSTPRFWDLVAERGEGVGIYKWLVTYPPRSVKGFMVPAWLAPAPVTWPSELSVVKEIELSNRLKRKEVKSSRSGLRLLLAGIQQGFRWSTVRDGVLWKMGNRSKAPKDKGLVRRGWAEKDKKQQRDRRVALERLRVQMDRDVFVSAASQMDPELLTFTLYSIDSLGHSFWKFHEPEAFEDVSPEDVDVYGEVIVDAYSQADAVLGELLDAVEQKATVVVLSDHGFQALSEESANKSYFAPKTARLQARLRASLGELDVFRIGQKLTVSLRQDSQTLEALEGALNLLLDEKGEPFYSLEPVPDLPRSVGLRLADERVDEKRLAVGEVGGEPLRDYVQLQNSVSGDHHPEGIFVIRGEGIKAGVMTEEMQLLDVAPTLQGLLGFAPAQDLQGEARFGAPTGAPESRDAMVEDFVWLSDDGSSREVNDEKLKALGYVE